MKPLPNRSGLSKAASRHTSFSGDIIGTDPPPVLRERRYLTQEVRSWLRPLLVLGPLLLSALLATMASSSQLRLVSILVPALGMLVVFLKWPPIGLILTAVAGMVVPFYGPSGSNITMVLVVVLLPLWLLDMMVVQREIGLVPSRTTVPLIALLTVAFLSFGFGQFPWFSFASNTPLDAQLGGLSIVVLSAVAFLLVANQIKDLHWLSWLTWAFLAIGALSFIARSILPEFGLATRDLFQQVGSLFYVWLAAMAFSQAIFNRDLHRGWRIALLGLVVASAYVLFVLKFADKSGWIPATVCICAIVAFRSRWAALALLLVGALSTTYLVPQALNTESYSIATRFDAWLILAEIIKVSPIWGLGFANYYSYTSLLPIRGYAVSFNSHNNYVDIVAQMGFVGLACFVWFFWEAGRLGLRLRERATTEFGRAYAHGALGGLAGTVMAGMLGDWVLPFVYNIGLFGFRTSILAWIFLGGLVALEQIERQGNVEE